MPEIPDELWEAVAQDPEQLRLMREAGMVSAMVVPMRVRGTVIGDLALTTAESGRRYTADDLERAQQLADQCALAIDNARLHTTLRETRDDLRAILEGVADAVTAQAPDGRLVYANDAAVRLLGYADAGEMLAADPRDFRDRFEMFDERRRAGPDDRSAGPPCAGRRAPAAADGPLPRHHQRHRALVAHPVDAGVRRRRRRPPGDQRDRGHQRAQARGGGPPVPLRGQPRPDRLAGLPRDPAGVARLAVPRIADWCAVDLADGDEIERVAVAHVDPARVELRARQAYPPTRATRVSTACSAVAPPSCTANQTRCSARRRATRSTWRSCAPSALRSAMLLPMRLRDRVLGVISFVSSGSGRRFDEQDLLLAEDLALRAAAAVENARLYETASSIAATLQSSLLPPVLPEIPAIELAAAYRPAGAGLEVGGDFYDVFSTAEDQWYAVVGDVCGKGAEAAAVTALARYTIRAAAVRRRSPSAILRWLSDAMLQQAADDDGRFCTIACAHVDVSRSPARVTVACGGHPLPLVVRADGATEHFGSPGTLLGLVESPDLQDRTAELRGGDTLVLYTDGLTEAGAPARVWTPEELADTARTVAGAPAATTVDHLIAATVDSVARVRDDVAVLALRAA